jgi:DNA-binding response OmpR family regulator
VLSGYGARHCLRGARILVAEDEVLIAIELKSVLCDAGADVVGPMLTVRDALAAASQVDLSAAILDITLGRSSIVPVARILTSRGIPFVFYTGQADVRTVAAEWPDRKILAKPVMPRVLVDTLVSLC